MEFIIFVLSPQSKIYRKYRIGGQRQNAEFCSNQFQKQ